jgi:hypothetical protein
LIQDHIWPAASGALLEPVAFRLPGGGMIDGR